MMNPDTQRLDQELSKLRNNGLVLPTHPFRAAQSYKAMADVNNELRTAASHDINGLSASLGRKITAANYDTPEVQRIMNQNNALANAMGAGRGLGNRTAQVRQRANRQDQRWSTGFSPKTSMVGSGQGSPMGGDVYNAIPRFYDPLEYWDLSGLPWNVADEGHRHKLHKWLRLYYATHYLIPVLVDIFTRFPLVGMELESKDPKVTEIYNDIFLDQLHYEDFLVNLGREFWLVGEAFPLGSFDEDLGIWAHEELINPEDVVIDNFPLLGTQQLKIVPPDYLRRIAQTRSPAREWYRLQEQYEELIPYLLKGEHIPISPVMLTQVANKLNDWDDHGTPILLRGLRTLLHEEKLLASQDAIAERLYSPFILAKLGIMDMGDGLPPWVPTPDELQSVRDDIDIAMASDFRVMVHHFGLDMTSVFGREQMPRLGDDFDRIERRLMQVFGVNPSLLSAGSNSQPYASSALQAEFMNQMLRTFQKTLKEHFKMRALVVAEAQGHYDYERKGQAQPLDAKVLTPYGWTTMGQIYPGDQVIGSDGLPHRVIETFPQGEKDIYRITFSDGSSTTCTRDHLWSVTPVHGRNPQPITLTTGQMLDQGVSYPSGPNKWKIPHVEPVQYINWQDSLPIHPYLLGLLLGDGHLGSETYTEPGTIDRGGSVYLASGYHDYEEIIELIKPVLPPGVHIVTSNKPGVVHIKFSRDEGVYANPLRSALRELGLLGKVGEQKFIPETYLLAGPEERLELLRGLIDSDGHCYKHKHGVLFANNSQLLIDGVKDLVGSLGGSYHEFNVDPARPNEKELYIKRLTQTPCLLRRKVQAYETHAQTRSLGYRHITDISFEGYAEAQCILVDAPDHLYVTDDYIVTHNTRVPIYETVVKWDEEGNKQISREKKLLVPDLNFACLAYGSRVTTPYGPVKTEDLKVGDSVIGWDLSNDRSVLAEVTHSYDNGPQEVYRIHTKLGRTIDATGEHPFLTPNGWVTADRLVINDNLRIGSDIIGYANHPVITEREAKFLGLIVGDGCTTQCDIGGVPQLSTTDPEIIDWVNHFLSGYGCSLTPGTHNNYYISQIDQRVNPNPIKELLRNSLLIGKSSFEKRVPMSVWCGSRGVWSAFLSGYLDADGTVAANKSVVWDSRNKDLMKDVQDLLAALNIRSTLFAYDGSRWPDPQGNIHDGLSYRVQVQSREGLNSCQKWLEPILSRKRSMSTSVRCVDERRSLSPEQAQEIQDIVATKKNRLSGPTYREIGEKFDVSPSTVLRAVQGEYDDLIATWVNPRWDSIVDIELIADTPTWSLGISGDHTHVTEGLVTHNTFDLRDEATERQFIMGLRQAGLPIPDEKLMIGVTWKDDDYIDEYNRSIQRKTISQQQAKMDTYIALVIKGLPVPMDLKYEVESVLQGGTGPEAAPAPPGGEGQGAGGDPAAGGGAPPPGGVGGAPDPTGKPGGGIVMPPPPPGLAPGGSPPPTQPGGAGAPSPGGSVPQVSNERRQGLTYNTSYNPSLDHLEPINTKYDLGETIKDWPEDMQRRARAIYDAVQLGGDYVISAVDVKEAATIENSSETDDPETWEVKSNQKIEEIDGTNAIVARTKRVIVPIESSKRYSIIDPSVDPISYETEFTKPEQPGPRTSSDTGDEPDSVGGV